MTRMAIFTGRIAQSALPLFFLGMATLAAALGFPVKVVPPPKRRTPDERTCVPGGVR